MNPSFTSVRTRFLAIHLPILLIAVLGVFCIAEWLNYRSEVDRLERDLDTMAASQSIIVAAAVAEMDTSQVRAAVASAIASPDVRGIAVYDDDGNLIDAYGEGYDDAGGLVASTGINYADESGIRRVGSLSIAMNTEPTFDRLKQRLLNGAIFGLISVVAAMFAAQIAFGRTVATPLARLLGVIEKTRSGKHRESVEWNSDDELGRVIKAYNELQIRESANETALKEIQSTLESRVRERTRDLDRARREAIEANNAKSEFLASMSHELRTPLNGVLGFCQILKMARKDHWTAHELDYLEMIEKSGDILLRLIDQVLDLNKIESGSIALELEDVALATAVEEAVGIITAEAEAASVLIDVDIESFVGLSVKADPFRLQQVLLNLLSNAIKYNRENGRIDLAGHRIDASVEIIVADTGIGIADEDYERAFEPFNRLNQTGGTISGAGLGLTISRRLTEMMGGKLAFESQVGIGTTFRVTLAVGAEPQLTRDFIRLRA
ncbi:MAG: ATP-binding protein [Rhodospirillales bacterium]